MEWLVPTSVPFEMARRLLIDIKTNKTMRNLISAISWEVNEHHVENVCSVIG